MKSNDDSLQARAERPDLDEDGLSREGRAEVALYRELFSILEEEPAFTLPADFAYRVATQVKPRPSGVAEWLPVIIMSLVGAVYTFLLPPARVAVGEVTRSVGEVLPLGLFAVVTSVIFTIYLVDKWLVRGRFVAS